MASRLQRRRRFFAILCVIAVPVFYAPPAAAAWSAYSASCCTSGQCTIKGHHHQHAQAAPDASEHGMDCGHKMTGMMACSMSCCQGSDRPALGATIFVLPAPFALSAHTIFERFVSLPAPTSSLRSAEPLSPPPRLSSAAS